MPTISSPSSAQFLRFPVPLLALSAVAVFVTGCGAKRDPVANTEGERSPVAASAPAPANAQDSRAMVLWDGAQISDLYWNGMITSADERRWNVGFLPGIAPTGTVVANSWNRAGGYYQQAFPAEHEGISPARSCWRWAWGTVASDFMIGGIGRDGASSKSEIGSACREKPFGWPAVVVYEAVSGYVVKPAGRLLVGGIGTALGGTAAVGCGAVQGAVPTVGAVADIAVVGTVYPTLRLAWHHPAWALSLVSAEPQPWQDGRWTLRIVSDPVRDRKLYKGIDRAADGGPKHTVH